MAHPNTEQLLMECEEDDLAPWQHSPEEGEGPGKKMGGSEQPGADPGEQTIILTLVPVSPTAQPLVQAQTHRSPDPVPMSVSSTYQNHISPGPMLTSVSSTFQNQNPLSRPLVLMPVSTSSLLTSAPLTNSSRSSPSGLPIILSAQSLQGASTDQTNQQGLILNGQPITILPRGQGTPILPQPSAKVGLAASGSTVQIPVTLTIRSSTGIQTISTVASGSINLSSTTSSSTALPSTSPIITEVVSVGASDSADRHAVHTPPPPQPAPASSSSSSRSPLVSQGKGLPPGPPKGLLTPTKPKTCKHCGFRYKTINSLRGYLCMCSVEVAWSLKKISTASKPFQRSSKRARSSRDSSSSSDSSSDSNTSKQKAKKKKSSMNETTNSRQKQSPQQKEMSKGKPVVLKRGRGRPRKDESERLREKEVGKGRSREELGELDSVVRPVYGHPGTPILEAGPQDKLIIMVEDFYYGTDQTCRPSAAVSERQPSGFKCVHCDQSIVNNIKLMNHTQRHVEISHQNDDVATHTSCQHCFRHFPTPYRLQGHVESVHVQSECTTKCKICEWAFESEPVFLQHMKNYHRPGEMPYVCQVCRFRSSFYTEVVDHFRAAHNGTFHLLCPYCLRVFRSGACYQHHYSRHQKKNVFSCDRCRLHFLFAKERAEHKVQDHKTHIKPKQLEGLKPGTRVTIRTYAAPDTRSQLMESLGMPPSPPQVIEVPPGPKTTVSPKRTPPESQIKLLTCFQTRSPVLKKHLCVECSFAVPDFANHYPTYVHCSLCRFRTCCSRAYANHMINNHVTRKTTTKYEALYNSYPRESKMRCTKCHYSSTIGDMMANHLTDHPEHLVCSFSDELDVMSDDPELTPTSVPTSPQSGSFVPLHLLSSGTSQVSIKPLLSTSRPPTPSPSPTSFTITLQGSLASIRDGFREGELEPRKSEEPRNEYAETRREALLKTLSRINPGPSASDPSSASPLALNKPLTVRQLTIVLYALCSGLHQAAQRYGALTSDIQTWTQHQDRLRLKKEWSWCTDRIAEWVLTQREQQLPINEDNLLQTAIEALEEAQEMGDFYQWAVEFMLRHNLGLQASLASPIKHPLPRNIYESTRIFTRFVAKQTRDMGFQPKDIATLDELSVFVDPSLLSEGSPAALQVFGGGKAPIDVVLAGRADGSLLTPMVFLRGKPSDLKPLGDSVLLETRPEGFTDDHRLQLWLSKVWQKRELAPQGGKGLLVMDTHRGHLANGFLTPLGKTSTIPAVIPIGCSSRLQPLEVCVAPVLREFLQTRWRHLVAGGGGAGLSLASLALKLTDWLGELVTCLRDRPNILARSFKIVCAPPSEDDQGSAADITKVLTEVLIGSLDKEKKVQEEEHEEPMVVEAESNEVEKEKPEEKAQSEVASPQAELQAIRQVFEKDSDLESFHGFEEKEITEYMRTCSSASPCQSL